MRNLLNFIVKYSSWLLFILLVALSCAMLFTVNPYQHHVYLTSAGSVASAVYRTSNSITSYFALRDINDDLQRRNASLELEVLNLRQQLAAARRSIYADTMTVDSALQRYSFIVADVINRTTWLPRNYITINKGSLDGVRPEMGVVDQNGVVGIVNVTGPHTSRVMSLLNPLLRLSCKARGSEYVGSLQWDGVNPGEAVLDELPPHARFHRGDTVVTSGYSSAFPAGVPVGTILSGARQKDGNFVALRIKLFTDFTTLSTVRIVRDVLADELRQVETDPDNPTTIE